MSQDIISDIKANLQTIDTQLSEIIESNILTDPMYTKVTRKIGHIDDLILNSNHRGNDEYLQWVKQRLDKISNILINLEKHAARSLQQDNEDLMHPSGDYFNEDNSISLSDDVKKQLADILNDQHKS